MVSLSFSLRLRVGKPGPSLVWLDPVHHPSYVGDSYWRPSQRGQQSSPVMSSSLPQKMQASTGGLGLGSRTTRRGYPNPRGQPPILFRQRKSELRASNGHACPRSQDHSHARECLAPRCDKAIRRAPAQSTRGRDAVGVSGAGVPGARLGASRRQRERRSRGGTGRQVARRRDRSRSGAAGAAAERPTSDAARPTDLRKWRECPRRLSGVYARRTARNAWMDTVSQSARRREF